MAYSISVAGTCPFSSIFYSPTYGTYSVIMLGTCVMATLLLCHGPGWQMVALTARGWLSAVLGCGMGSSRVGAGIRIWMDGWHVIRVCNANSVCHDLATLPLKPQHTSSLLTLPSDPGHACCLATCHHCLQFTLI